jgi:hypothetical protein
VSPIESAIDQTRHPGMKRTWGRSPDRFQIANMATAGTSVEVSGEAKDGSFQEQSAQAKTPCSSRSTYGPRREALSVAAMEACMFVPRSATELAVGEA